MILARLFTAPAALLHGALEWLNDQEATRLRSDRSEAEARETAARVARWNEIADPVARLAETRRDLAARFNEPHRRAGRKGAATRRGRAAHGA